MIDESTAAINGDGVVVRLNTFPLEDFPAARDDEYCLVGLWPTEPLVEALGFVNRLY